MRVALARYREVLSIGMFITSSDLTNFQKINFSSSAYRTEFAFIFQEKKNFHSFDTKIKKNVFGL